MKSVMPKKPGHFSRLWQEQKKAAYTDAQKQFWAETVAGARRLSVSRRTPSRVESFEAAVERLGLTDVDLAAQRLRFTVGQLLLYAFAGLLLAYATYVGLNVSLYTGCLIAAASVAAAIQGYVLGFRVWQIKHRSLIRLQDAIRRLDTYLVL